MTSLPLHKLNICVMIDEQILQWTTQTEYQAAHLLDQTAQLRLKLTDLKALALPEGYGQF